LKRRAFLQGARQRAGKRDFEAIEDPGDTERQHDTRMKPAPAEIVEPRGNAGFDDAVIVLRHGRGSARAIIRCRDALCSLQIHHINQRASTPGNHWPKAFTPVCRQP